MASDQLIEGVEEARESGMTFYWQVTEPRVHIDGQTAWITYVNRGSIRIGADQREMVWLESAVLRKTGEAWRIRFLHGRSEEHTSELQSLMRISYDVVCQKNKKLIHK